MDSIKKNKLIYIIMIFLFYFFWTNINAIDLKALREKTQHSTKLQQKQNNHILIKNEQKKKVNKIDNNILKFRNIEIDQKFYDSYKGQIDEKLKLYDQYIKEQNEEKKKAMEIKYHYLILFKKQVKEIKTLLKQNNFLYMGNVYLPSNSNLIFFRYNEKLYFIPAFTTKIESKSNLADINSYINDKYKQLKKKYNINKINKINKKDEFDNLDKNFGLISFDSIKKWLNIFSDTNANIIIYPTAAVKEALKERWIKYNTKWIFSFFILNNYNDTITYRTHYLKSTIKVVSDYFMNIWVNNIWINWYNNNFWYKEIMVPLRVIKKQKITVIKTKNLGIIDLIVFLLILGWWWFWIYLWLKKMFNIYNDLE